MIIPKTRYPGQTIVSDPAYPHGKARNIDTPGDGSGTPWEKDLVNDWFGFQQALVANAGITPNGTPDKVGACQLLSAIDYRIRQLVDANKPTRVAVPLNLAAYSLQWNDVYADPSAPAVRVVAQATAGANENRAHFTFSLPFTGMRFKTTGIVVHLNGASGHSVLPENMPTVQLGVLRHGFLDSPLAAIALGTDASANVSAYQATHELRGAFVSTRNIDPAHQYHVTVIGEGGDDSIVGTRIHSIVCELEPIP